jgi:hypothetical protein
MTTQGRSNHDIPKSGVSFIALLRSYPATGPVPGVCKKGNDTGINNRPQVDVRFTDDIVEGG